MGASRGGIVIRIERMGAVVLLALVATSVVAPSSSFAAADDEKVFRIESKEKIDLGGKDRKAITVEVDVTEAPDAKDWARKAADYALEWYPKLCEALPSEGYEPPTDIRLEFKPMDGVAHASGSTVTISSKWIEKYPDDLGMVAHELVHVVQRYKRRGGPGWLTEGIADYVRYYVVEPGSKRAAFDRQKSNYRSGYQPAAGLLNWIEKKKPGTVVKLNTALREGRYTDDLFKKLAGGNADELWDQFKADANAK